MDRDKVLELAREAGLMTTITSDTDWSAPLPQSNYPNRLERFAALIEAEVCGDAEPVAWYTEDHLTDKSATTWSKDAANKWRSKGWPVFSLYAHPSPAVVRQLVEAVAAAKLDIHSARLCEVNSMSSRSEVCRLMGSACEKLGAALAAAKEAGL